MKFAGTSNDLLNPPSFFLEMVHSNLSSREFFCPIVEHVNRLGKSAFQLGGCHTYRIYMFFFLQFN